MEGLGNPHPGSKTQWRSQDHCKGLWPVEAAITGLSVVSPEAASPPSH